MRHVLVTKFTDIKEPKLHTMLIAFQCFSKILRAWKRQELSQSVSSSEAKDADLGKEFTNNTICPDFCAIIYCRTIHS